MLKHWHRRKTRRRAIVFIDYESWFYSYKRLFHFRPDPRSFRAELEKEYDLEDIMIFGDFSPADAHAVLDIEIEAGSRFAELLGKFLRAGGEHKCFVGFRNGLAHDIGADIGSDVLGAVVVFL